MNLRLIYLQFFRPPGTNPLEMESGTGKLRLGDTYIDAETYTAPDILANLAEQRRSGSPVKRLMASAESMADAEARREAVYCDSPFFTLWLPNGQVTAAADTYLTY
jgi:hypothetical protein